MTARWASPARAHRHRRRIGAAVDIGSEVRYGFDPTQVELSRSIDEALVRAPELRFLSLCQSQVEGIIRPGLPELSGPSERSMGEILVESHRFNAQEEEFREGAIRSAVGEDLVVDRSPQSRCDLGDPQVWCQQSQTLSIGPDEKPMGRLRCRNRKDGS
jgi:hypothetical protein